MKNIQIILVIGQAHYSETTLPSEYFTSEFNNLLIEVINSELLPTDTDKIMFALSNNQQIVFRDDSFFSANDKTIYLVEDNTIIKQIDFAKIYKQACGLTDDGELYFSAY